MIPYYKCYYCAFTTDDEEEYISHGAVNHLYRPMFPNPAELKQYNLTPQGRRWEKDLMTDSQAVEKLADWVEKRLNEEQNEALRNGKLLYKRHLVQTYSYDDENFQRRLVFDPETSEPDSWPE